MLWHNPMLTVWLGVSIFTIIISYVLLKSGIKYKNREYN